MKFSERLNALTSLRFFAAALIVIHHYPADRLSSILGHPTDIFGFNYGDRVLFFHSQAVSFFFVLSGFILFINYSKLSGWPDILSFWRARFARLWPALFVCFLLSMWIHHTQWDYRTGLANLLMINAWIPLQKYYWSYNGPSWSISTEFFFYLVFPILIYKWERTWKIKLAAAALVVGIIIVTFSYLHQIDPVAFANQKITPRSILYINPITRVFEFIFGMCVASYWLKQKANSNRNYATLYELGAVFLVLLFMSSFFVNSVTESLKNTFFDPAFVLWIERSGGVFTFGLLIYVMAMGQGQVSKWLCNPFMVLLGEISYSLYLLHVPILSFYGQYFHPFPNISRFYLLVIFWIFILAASYLMWSLVEMPGRRILLGKSKSSMHGTALMKNSWHINPAMKLRNSVAILIISIITISFFILSPRNINQITPEDAASLTPDYLKSSVNTRFGNQFMLRGVNVFKEKGIIKFQLAWESLIKQNLNYATGLFFTDSTGQNLFNANFNQPSINGPEEAGGLWLEEVSVNEGNSTGLRYIGLVLFQGEEDPLLVDNGKRDWNSRRLLIDLGEGFSKIPQLQSKEDNE